MSRMMVGMVCSGLILAGGGFAQEPKVPSNVEGAKAPLAAPGFITVKDHAGREWKLEDWKEGTAKFPAPEDVVKYREWLKDATRPYPKDLKEREAWHLKKNGENWDGPVYGHPYTRIMTPGDWKWEYVVTLPDELAKQLSTKPPTWTSPVPWRPWGFGGFPLTFLYAAGAGEVTDIYACTGSGYVHADAKTKKVTFIGSPTEGGKKDGLGSEARLSPWGDVDPTLDIVSGRIYWMQGKTFSPDSAFRYLDKLLPYKDKANGKEYLLPALLDYKELYKKVKSPGNGELELVMKDGQRAAPSFAVHTHAKFKNMLVPGSHRGKRPLLTPDGKGIWLSEKDSGRDTNPAFDNTSLFEIETGKKLEPLKLAVPFPATVAVGDGVCSHGGTCVGLDGVIYMCHHCGCGGGPCRLFSIDPADGKITRLYDSAMGVSWGKWGKKVPQWDGPADASSLTATSTKSQMQCPRTGAIINGGWDESGLRRYQDGFLTSVLAGNQGGFFPGRPGFSKDTPSIDQSIVDIAPNGDIYAAHAKANASLIPIVRFYRTDWPKEQPEYGYGEKVMPRAKLEELMLEYAKKYIENYEANSRF